MYISSNAEQTSSVAKKNGIHQMAIPDTSVPVVVLKTYHHMGLGIVRSLGRLGVRIYGVDPNPRAAGLHSRYCHGRFAWDVDHAAPEKTVQFLLDLGKEIGHRSILIHTADESAVLLAEHAEALSKWYIFPHQSPDLVKALVSKKEMYFLAKQHNIPTAETVFPQSRGEVEHFLDNASFPIMLKGIDGRLLEERTGKKMVIVRDKRELLEQYDKMEDPQHPNLMLQEYIPGGEDSIWMFNGYFNGNSDCLYQVTGKKIRQAPPYTGYTSLGICLHNEEVARLTRDFMKKVGYKGILDIGYRYDARDGLYKVLDINPRIGATFRLFVARNGCDVARVAYCDLTGQPVIGGEVNEGRKWFVEDRDIVSSIRYFRDKKLSINQWIRSFRDVEESAWFSTDDPLPFFLMVWQLAKRGVSLAMPWGRNN
jgi:D-aspartate ligase